MNEIEIFKHLPWHPGDSRTVLVKVAWFERAGGARETPMLKPFSRRLERKGFIARVHTDNGRIALTLTPAGRDVVMAVLLETVVGHRPMDFLVGSVVRWTEARYIRRLLAAADEEDHNLNNSHAARDQLRSEETCA